MSPIVFIALFFPVILSGLSFYFFNTTERALKLIIAFGGAFLLSLSFIELLPEIYTTSSSATIGIFVLVGFFIQLLLDFLTKGVEHGHHGCHEHGHGINPYGIMIGICIHSFLEGMPLVDNLANDSLKNTLLSGIVIHNIPISIVLVGILSKTGLKKSSIIILLTIFALSAPIGTLSSYFIGTGILENVTEYFNIILAIVVGIFLHISTTILFETDEQHHFNFYKFIAVLLGFGTAIALFFIL